MQSFFSTGQSTMLISGAPHYAQSIEDVEDESYDCLLFGAPSRLPCQIIFFGMIYSFSWRYMIIFLYLVYKKDHPPLHEISHMLLSMVQHMPVIKTKDWPS